MPPKQQQQQSKKNKKNKKKGGQTNPSKKVVVQIKQEPHQTALRSLIARAPHVTHKLAYALALPDQQAPIRLPDEAPQETRVLGLMVSSHVNILGKHTPPLDAEFGFPDPHAILVVSRQPSRPLLMSVEANTSGTATRFYAFFGNEGTVESHPPMVDGSDGTFGAVDVTFSNTDAGYHRFIGAPIVPEFVGCCPQTSAQSNSAGATVWSSRKVNLGGVFEHVGITGGSRGVFLTAGTKFVFGIIPVNSLLQLTDFTGAGGASVQLLSVPASVVASTASLFRVDVLLKNLGSEADTIPEADFTPADGNVHHADGSILCAAAARLNAKVVEATFVVSKTGYYQIIVKNGFYKLLNNVAGAINVSGEVPLLRCYAYYEDVIKPFKTGVPINMGWKVVCPADLNGSDLPLLDHCRPVGVSLLCKNLSNALSLGGAIYCRRTLDASSQSMAESIRLVQNIEQSVRTAIVPAATGLYTWLPPSNDDLIIRPYVDRYGVPLYHLDIESPQHVALLELPGDSVSQSSFFLKLCVNIEFITNLQRYSAAGITPFGIEEMSRVRHAMVRYPLFLDNPNHIRKLIQTLASGMTHAGHWVRQNRQVVFPLVDAVNPVAGQTLRALSRALSAVNMR